MNNSPMILPLDCNGSIYALLDEQGRTIGTGSRSVCEVLLYMITKSEPPTQKDESRQPVLRPNVRSAIPI